MVAHNVVSTIGFVKMCPFIGQIAVNTLVCYMPRPICVVRPIDLIYFSQVTVRGDHSDLMLTMRSEG